MAGKPPPAYGSNLLRSGLQGLTFENADELEAFLRASGRYAMGQPWQYRDIKRDINADLDRFKVAHPVDYLAANLGGAFVPGVVGALVPGGQGATLSTLGRTLAVLPRVSRAMAEPLTVAAARYAPRMAAAADRYAKPLMPVLDEVLSGAITSAGAADTISDIPSAIVTDMPLNVAQSLGIRSVDATLGRGIKSGATKVIDRFKVRRNAKKGR